MGRGDRFVYSGGRRHYIFGTTLIADPDFFPASVLRSRFVEHEGVLGGTSIAVLTYIGFDGYRRFRKKPRIRAGIFCGRRLLTCSGIGILSAVEVLMPRN